MPALSTPSVSYDAGRARIIADLRTALGLELYRYGHPDPDIELVRRLLGPGDVFVDGGANIGLFTLAAASCVGPRGRVISFEPASSTRRILSRNVDLNGFDWVRIRSEALDERTGVRSFTVLKGNSSGLSSFHPAVLVGAESEVENVSAISIDDVLTSEERTRLALIKLDLEGAEYAALMGAKRLLAEVGPDFLIELEPAHLERHGASAKKLIELFTAQGYRFYRPRLGFGGRLELAPEVNPSAPASAPNLLVSRNLDRVHRAAIPIVG